MSHKGGQMCEMESVRLSINEHLASVGEEILSLLEKHSCVDVCWVKLNVRVFVLERLSAVEEFIFNLFKREMETLETLLERQNKLLDVILQPHIKLHRGDFLHLPLCKEEVSPEQQERTPSIYKEEPESLPLCKQEVSPEQQERTPSLVKEEPGSPHIKEELLDGPEDKDGSILTILVGKSEDDDDDENTDTEPVASTSTQHMETQADVQDCGTSHPTSDEQLYSSHCSESDTEDSDEWEIREDQSLITPKSHKTQNVEGQRLSFNNNLPRDLELNSHTWQKGFNCTFCGKMFNRKENLNQHVLIHTGVKPFKCAVCGKDYRQMGHLKTHMRTHTGEQPFICTVCGKGCGQIGQLKTHMRTHTGEKPFICSVCGKGCVHMGHLKIHMQTHTGEKPFTCTLCGKGCGQRGELKIHMRTHTGERPFSCTVCEQSFSRNDKLKKHLLTHTEGKPL